MSVELDGARWRTLPAEAVVRAGLCEGLELDRPQLRALRRELRRVEALARATRALASRDHSERSLAARLERAGFAAAERAEAVGALRRAGYLDDARLARSRAAALAERGAGDALIRDDLERRGVDGALADAAVAELEPERERARRLADSRGGGIRAARWLAAKGFAPESLEGIVADET